MNTENRNPTNEEHAWWKKFRSMVRKMPKTMEVIVSAHGSLSAAPRGAVLAALNSGADAGVAEVLTLSSIDGRESGFVDGGGGL